MAGADQILKKIMDDARADALAATQEAEERCRVSTARSERAMEEARKAAMESAEAAAAQKQERRMRMAHLDARKEDLAMKRELIDLSFEAAGKELLQLDTAKRERLYERMLLDAAEGGEELIPASADKSIFTPTFVKRLNTLLAEKGVAEVTLSKDTREMGGGFVLKSGGMECNCSLEALIRQRREEIEPQVVKTLFPEQGG